MLFEKEKLSLVRHEAGIPEKYGCVEVYQILHGIRIQVESRYIFRIISPCSASLVSQVSCHPSHYHIFWVNSATFKKSTTCNQNYLSY